MMPSFKRPWWASFQMFEDFAIITSKLKVGPHVARIWAKNGRSLKVPGFKHCRKLMVWGAISFAGKSELLVLRGRVNSQVYQDTISRG
jgi:hypothetical protein